VAIAVSALAAPAAAEPALSLQEAVQIALREHPSIQAAQAGVDLAEAQKGEARAARLPLVHARQGLTHGNNPVFVFGSRLEQSRFRQEDFDLAALNDPDALTNLRSEIGLQWSAFDQLQSGARVAQARLGLERAGHHKRLAEQRIRLEVIRTYYGALVAEAHKQVADEAVRTAEADVERTRNMVGTGLRVDSDLLAAEVQLADLRQQQIQAAGEVATSRAALNTALGLDLDTPHELSGELLDLRLEPPGEAELRRLALEHRPELASARTAERSASEELRASKGRYLPRLDVYASHGRSGSSFEEGSSDSTLGANLTLNLFEPGRSSRVDRARAQQSLARAEAEGLARQVGLEVVRTYRQFVSARDRLAVATQAVQQAAEALRIVQDRYAEGLTTITEVLRAETALLDARKGALDARYATYVGYAGVLLASGRLTDVEAFTAGPGNTTGEREHP
jgi:outer membrane protein TolC